MLIHLRKTLFAGIVVLVPLVVTFKVMQILFRFTDGILGNALSKLLEVRIPGLGLLLFVVLIYLSGLATRTFFGKNFLRWTDILIERIPVVRTIYSGVKQLLGPFGEDGRKTFGKPVLVEYPAPGTHTYGFLVKEQVDRMGDAEMVNVFIPSNHLHLGVVVLARRDALIELDMTFEEMIKLMASCGVAGPDIRMTAKL
ncbi:MAG: hypothetical protein A3G34_17230 [Candidatus Lindowbacteria bacterium RIFCSPLOWO2_12_FULL_62_27]|nr:MAG: hypothetical protein A3G34_17230 [Candidatus Lindowbacteria bacterium RIFCSPLOWO2_12_FULL_62_27]OGH63993.1 MAG: hypothetical protein A3I06_10585 [Candidatus Lindowbacteria bacterium RIFCSPLOWO2_02_FULL_62_12]